MVNSPPDKMTAALWVTLCAIPSMKYGVADEKL